jgi:hypothetical protein
MRAYGTVKLWQLGTYMDVGSQTAATLAGLGATSVEIPLMNLRRVITAEIDTFEGGNKSVIAVKKSRYKYTLETVLFGFDNTDDMTKYFAINDLLIAGKSFYLANVNYPNSTFFTSTNGIRVDLTALNVDIVGRVRKFEIELSETGGV